MTMPRCLTWRAISSRTLPEILSIGRSTAGFGGSPMGCRALVRCGILGEQAEVRIEAVATIALPSGNLFKQVQGFEFLDQVVGLDVGALQMLFRHPHIQHGVFE